jgi:hypothetical protein
MQRRKIFFKTPTLTLQQLVQNEYSVNYNERVVEQE